MIGAVEAILLCSLAGILASAVGGMTGILLLLVGSNGLDRAIPVAFLAAILGAGAGIAYAAVPSILVGASLWFATRAERRLDRAVSWIGAGIVAGLAMGLAYGTAAAAPIRDGYSEGISPIGVAFCFAASGAVGALMFRQTMRELAGFLPPNDAPDQTNLISRSRS